LQVLGPDPGGLLSQRKTTEALRTLRATRKYSRDVSNNPGAFPTTLNKPQVGASNQGGIAWAYDGNAGQAGVQYPANAGLDIRYRPGVGYSNPAVDDIPADYD